MAWSSTVSIRIESVSLLMISLRSLPGGPALERRLCVGDRGRNSQLNLRTGIEFAPYGDLAPRKFGTFVHAGQAVMPGASASVQNLLVNALAVVYDAQAKLPWVITDFH